jgi:AcrR family transcriptional regulator
MRVRAMNEAEKGERRRAILDAALALWTESSYDGLTMDGVADRTGLAKGTLYRYFATKEELLLELFEKLIAGWLQEVNRRLDRARGILGPAQVGRILGRTLQGREALPRLLTLVGGILEHNISDARARTFKDLLRTHMAGTARCLARRLPSLGEAGATRFLLHAYALLAGLGQMAYPAPVIRRVLEEPRFEIFRIDLSREFAAGASALLRGHGVARSRRRGNSLSVCRR